MPQSLPNVVAQEIDEDISTPRGSLNYPYIHLTEAKEVLGLIVPLLQPGPLQITIDANNAQREIGTVAKSILELDKLARVCPFEFRTKETHFKITCTQDLFNMPEEIWTQ